jgi:type I restriction-modification system DNA methylase subunit
MTNEQLKDLKETLWSTADQLRANSGLKSTEYATPILGLIFLRFAESKYSQYEADIKAEYNKNKGKRAERPIHEIVDEIYEYFLGEFALAEGQGGGEFFTPSTVVRYMVEVLAKKLEKKISTNLQELAGGK